MSSIRYEEIVRKCYYDILNRIPDQHGLEHFTHLLKENKIDEKKLIELLKESEEFKQQNCEITDSPEDKKILEIIELNFQQILNRESDVNGEKYFFTQIKNNNMNTGDLIQKLKESEEFKQQNCEITDSPEDKKILEIIELNFMKILNREPDRSGLKYFFTQIKNNNMNTGDLIQKLKESPEYKFSHPLEVDSSISIDLRMKKEWDERAKLDPLFAIATGFSETEKDFWDSGKIFLKNFLGLETPRFKKIIQNKEPSKMKILEIGCGLGRVLIPMCDYFGECIGIDVSPEMVQQSQKYIENLPNCKILENNGTDLSMFADNSFDFCFSYIVFQHIPEKKIVEQYIKEVSRVLKSNCLFRFQVRGIVDRQSKEITTWDGVQFSSNEIHEIANKNNFKIIEESDDKPEYYWFTFLSVK
jgi:SAM-dependent methyltransferase